MPAGEDRAAPTGIRNIADGGIQATMIADGTEGFWNPLTGNAEATIDIEVAPGRSALFVFRDTVGWTLFLYDDMFMRWRGVWDTAETYHRGQVARDGLWSAVANKTTQSYLSPYLSSEPQWAVFPTDPTWVPNTTTATRVLSGLRIRNTAAAYVTGLRVWIPLDPASNPDIQYSVLITSENSSASRYIRIYPDQIGWYILTKNDFMYADETIDAYLVTQGVGTSIATFTGEWDFRVRSSNPNPAFGPPAGQLRWYGDSSPDTAYWQVNDRDGTDRTADIATLVAGDQITFENETNNVPNGTFTTLVLTENPVYYDGVGSDPGLPFFDCRVGPIPVPEPDQKGWYDFTMTHFLARPLESVYVVNQFAGNPILRGLYSEGGVADVVEDDNAYGVDVLYQDVIVSPDWDLLSFSG